MRVYRLCKILQNNDGRLFSLLAEHLGYATHCTVLQTHLADVMQSPACTRLWQFDSKNVVCSGRGVSIPASSHRIPLAQSILGQRRFFSELPPHSVRVQLVTAYSYLILSTLILRESSLDE